eukprot:gene3428-6799_t
MEKPNSLFQSGSDRISSPSSKKSGLQTALEYSTLHGLFPKHGISIRGIRDFIELCGGEETLYDLTTTDVCEKYVKPMTIETKKSYCMYLIETSPSSGDIIKTANVFISHAWKYKFLQVFNALLHHFNNSSDTQDSDVILWFDLFTNCQHGLNIPPPFEWWCETFMGAIKSIGRTVMVMQPWEDPITLTRAWCLWEIYCTANTNSQFEIALSGHEKSAFEKMITTNPGGFFDMLGKVDVRKSEAWSQADKDQIHDAVSKTIGHATLNTIVFSCIRGWSTQTMERKLEMLRIELGAENPTTLQCMHGLALLYNSLGVYNLAEALHVESLETRRRLFGDRDPNTLSSMNSLGTLYKNQGRLREADFLLNSCLELRTAVLTETHPDTLTSMNNLANLYNNQGKYDLAQSLYLSCLHLRKETLGEDHPDTLWTMNSLAVLYNDQGLYDLAQPLYEKCLFIRREKLGEDHPHTLNSMNNLANLYKNQGKYELSEFLHRRCLDLRREKLGEDHPDTLTSMNYLGMLYKTWGKYEEAQALYVRCLELRRSRLGESHKCKNLGESHKDTIYIRNCLDLVRGKRRRKEAFGI